MHTACSPALAVKWHWQAALRPICGGTPSGRRITVSRGSTPAPSRQELGWSEVESFVSPPAAGADATVRLLAVADLGQAEEDGSMEASEVGRHRSMPFWNAHAAHACATCCTACRRRGGSHARRWRVPAQRAAAVQRAGQHVLPCSSLPGTPAACAAAEPAGDAVPVPCMQMLASLATTARLAAEVEHGGAQLLVHNGDISCEPRQGQAGMGSACMAPCALPACQPALHMPASTPSYTTCRAAGRPRIARPRCPLLACPCVPATLRLHWASHTACLLPLCRCAGLFQPMGQVMRLLPCIGPAFGGAVHVGSHWPASRCWRAGPGAAPSSPQLRPSPPVGQRCCGPRPPPWPRLLSLLGAATLTSWALWCVACRT